MRRRAMVLWHGTPTGFLAEVEDGFMFQYGEEFLSLPFSEWTIAIDHLFAERTFLFRAGRRNAEKHRDEESERFG